MNALLAITIIVAVSVLVSSVIIAVKIAFTLLEKEVIVDATSWKAVVLVLITLAPCRLIRGKAAKAATSIIKSNVYFSILIFV
jgi:hypothetical protein